MSPKDHGTDSLRVNTSMARLYRALERLGRMLRRGEVSLDGAMEELERVAFDPSYSEAWAKMERDARRLGGRVGVRL